MQTLQDFKQTIYNDYMKLKNNVMSKSFFKFQQENYIMKLKNEKVIHPAKNTSLSRYTTEVAYDR